jgi:hypothetical protein
MFPTPGALRGFGQVFYHTRRIEIVPLQVEVLSPPKVVSIKRHNLKAGTYGVASPSLKSAPDSSLYLYDQHYRIKYRVTGPADDVRRWECRVAAGAFASPPYLGTRECLATIVPVDDTKPVDIYLCEPAMNLCNNGVFRRVACVYGVVKYPPETAEALRGRRKSPILKAIMADEEADDVA